jgi:hypothetical protein
LLERLVAVGLQQRRQLARLGGAQRELGVGLRPALERSHFFDHDARAFGVVPESRAGHRGFENR